MSTDFGTTQGRPNAGPGQGPGLSREVHVNRFYGGDEDGPCVQVTIGDRCVQLTQDGAEDLVERITASVGLRVVKKRRRLRNSR